MLSSSVDSNQDRRRAAVGTWQRDVTARVTAQKTARRTARRTARLNPANVSVMSGPTDASSYAAV
jgi:SH3-like domain-containing protein